MKKPKVPIHSHRPYDESVGKRQEKYAGSIVPATAPNTRPPEAERGTWEKEKSGWIF